jgi:hypothetical protein
MSPLLLNVMNALVPVPPVPEYTECPCFCQPPMRPKARGLVQHGGSPGWLEESDPAGVIKYVMEGRTACLFRTTRLALTGAAQLRDHGISSCCYKINVHNHTS